MGPSATDSGALAPRSGRLGGGGLGRWPRAACRSVGHGESRPGGVAQRERRRGPWVRCWGAAVLSGGGIGEPARQLVRAPEDLEVPAFDLDLNGRAVAHVWKKERGDGEPTRVCRDIGMSLWREVAASWVRRSGEGFSTRPSSVSRCHLPFFGDYRTPLISKKKSPTPGNDRVKSISGAWGSGCLSWCSKLEWSLPWIASKKRSSARRLGFGCSASTTSAGALPHPNRYSTKVVASTKMLPKTREAATWGEASARWRSRNLWQRSGTDTNRHARRTKGGFSTNSLR